MHISMVFQNSIQFLNLESINERKHTPVIQLLPQALSLSTAPLWTGYSVCNLQWACVAETFHVQAKTTLLINPAIT